MLQNKKEQHGCVFASSAATQKHSSSAAQSYPRNSLDGGGEWRDDLQSAAHAEVAQLLQCTRGSSG